MNDGENSSYWEKNLEPFAANCWITTITTAYKFPFKDLPFLSCCKISVENKFETSLLENCLETLEESFMDRPVAVMWT
jgi:hypothetical protein